jgi:tetratricopeptide (TPR) repeat protein
MSEDDATEATHREGPGTSAPRHEAASERLVRGTLVGRYVVLDTLGEGGMGVVYAAFDPELDRKVAIKLLQASAGGSESGGQAYLVREAQAMARLSHPNVIAVHDVGTLPGDRLFVAMELVEGRTLREWLKVNRPWREVLPVMRAAGAGLAAAHAAGLVHRDFKPDNVLVGLDGRVRVMDFGLARLRPDDEPAPRRSDLEIEKKSPLAEQLTEIGTVVGTPAYMAPELYRGAAADARTDQFSFGVALYEALYRTRPYERAQLRERAPKPKEPPDAGVPARVRRAVMRACSADPAQRLTSMDELLGELAVDPGARRRRIAIAAAALVVIGGVGAAFYASSHSRGQLCKGAERKLAGVWDAPTKQAVQAAFAATKNERAAQWFAAADKVLDRYAADWSTMSIESCEATRIHGEQNEQDMALRSDCLDARLDELRAFTQLLVKADNELAKNAEKASYGLDPIKDCSNLPALRAPNKPPPEAAAKLPEINMHIANAKASLISGKVGAAINHANAVLAIVKESHFEAAEAEAHMVVAMGQLASADMADASLELTAAAQSGVRGRRDDVLANSALLAAMAAAEDRKDEVARVWLAIGIAALSRIPGDRTLTYRRYQVEGMVETRSGDPRKGIAADEKALEIAKEMYGQDGMMLSQAEQELGLAYVSNQEYPSARAHLERALELVEHNEGPDATDVAAALGSLGMVYAHLDVAKARAAFERAIAIREKTLGKNSPALVPTFNNLADMLRKHGDPTGALPYAQKARDIAQKFFGVDSPIYHETETTYAQTLYALGKTAEVRSRIDKVLASEERVHSNALQDTLLARAEIELADSKWSDAIGFAERAVALIEEKSGKQAPPLWPILDVLGRAKLGLGKRDEARPVLERAAAIAKAANSSDDDTKALREALQRL